MRSLRRSSAAPSARAIMAMAESGTLDAMIREFPNARWSETIIFRQSPRLSMALRETVWDAAMAVIGAVLSWIFITKL